MAVVKCPRCEINFMRDDEGCCSVCRRELRRDSKMLQEEADMCIECGTAPAVSKEGLCAQCLFELKKFALDEGVSDIKTGSTEEKTDDEVDVISLELVEDENDDEDDLLDFPLDEMDEDIAFDDDLEEEFAELEDLDDDEEEYDMGYALAGEGRKQA